MIARVPHAHALPLILSAKLGLVAVPDSDLLTLSDASTLEPRRNPNGEAALDRQTVRDLLQTLGANLGMTLLTRHEDTFPDSEALSLFESAHSNSNSNPSHGSSAGTSATATSTLTSTLLATDAAVRRSLESLDAVWLRDGEVIACFVVETGLAGHESIRRLADLIALHPKLKAPLYAITLPELKSDLIAELHRPALLLPKKPLAETLRLLEWDKLNSEVEQLGDRARYLKPEFLEGISEPVTAPNAE